MPASLTSMAAAGRPLMVEGEHAPHPQLPPLAPPLGAGLPRELADAELEALLAAAPAGVRPALTALLCGIDPQALAALLWRDVDLARGTLRIGEREMTLPEPLRAVLATLVDATTTLDARVFAVAPDDLDAQTLIAAHDAGLERAGEVTVAALRHTFIAHLVRQGLRFAELTQIVGALAPEALNAYGALAPPGPKRPLGAIDPVLPALRRLAAGGVVDAR
jgi:integrase